MRSPGSATRTAVSAAVALLFAVPLAACSSGSTAASGQGPSAPAKTPSAPPKPGPLGVLPVPPGATAWTDNATAPMNAKAFVQEDYVKSAWNSEQREYARRKFESAIVRGWDNSDGSSQEVDIARFGNADGAKSQFNAWVTDLHDKMGKGGKKLTDSADGGVGTADATLDSEGNAKAELVARVGDEVVDVYDYAAAYPDPAAAKALLLKQVKALKSGQ